MESYIKSGKYYNIIIKIDGIILVNQEMIHIDRLEEILVKYLKPKKLDIKNILEKLNYYGVTGDELEDKEIIYMIEPVCKNNYSFKVA